jgi:hypothetical protein
MKRIWPKPSAGIVHAATGTEACVGRPNAPYMAQSGAIYKRLSRFRSLGDKNTAVWYICNRAIGVSPKWFIRCFRLQDALERLDARIDMDLAAHAGLQAGHEDEPGSLLKAALLIFTSDADRPMVRPVRGRPT